MSRLIHILILAFFALSFSTNGQTGAKVSGSTGKIEKTILELEQKYEEAVLKGQVSSLETLLADDFTAISSRAEIRNKTQEIDDIKPQADSDYSMEAFKLDEIKVRIVGNAAVVTGRSTLQVSFRGRSSKSVFRYTRVYAKRKNQWRMISQQLTRVP
jgi:ketosteroid isomerase-like protein